MPALGYIILTYEFRKINRRWAAYCKELGTATFGRSLPEAESRLGEAVLLHLNTLEDVGERERFFKDYDIKYYDTKPKKDIQINVSLDEEVFLRPHIQPIKEPVPA